MELGLGIHGEPGVRKCEVQPVDQIVDQLVTTIAKSKEEGGSGMCSSPLQSPSDQPAVITSKSSSQKSTVPRWKLKPVALRGQ